MGRVVGDFGWRACRGPGAGVLKDLGLAAIGRVWLLPAGYRRRTGGAIGSGDNRVLLMSYRARSRGRAGSGLAAGFERLDDDHPPAAARASIPVFLLATIFGDPAGDLNTGDEPELSCAARTSRAIARSTSRAMPAIALAEREKSGPGTGPLCPTSCCASPVFRIARRVELEAPLRLGAPERGPFRNRLAAAARTAVAGNL